MMHDTILSAVLAVICLVSAVDFNFRLRHDKCHFRSFEMSDIPFSINPRSLSWHG